MKRAPFLQLPKLDGVFACCRSTFPRNIQHTGVKYQTRTAFRPSRDEAYVKRLAAPTSFIDAESLYCLHCHTGTSLGLSRLRLARAPIA